MYNFLYSVFEIVVFVAVAVAALIMAGKKQKQSMLIKRKEQLKYDYSEMVSKISLLVSAGMSVRGAWERVAVDYHNSSGKKRYVYEEMWESYNQLRMGMSELTVYEQFGRRCGTKEYLKFSTLLIQNMKKGTKDLILMLELECIEAFEERKNLARKYGEEAGTKLIFPMIVMLAVVMVIIMYPAMVSFGY